MSTKFSGRLVWGTAGLVLGAGAGYWVGRTTGLPGGDSVGGSGWEQRVSGEGGALGSGQVGKAGGSSPVAGKGSTGEVAAILKEVKDLPPGQGLRRILSERDPVKRLSLMREWLAGLDPETMVVVMKEFQGMLEAQERVGGEEVVGMFFQSLEVVAQGMVDRGASDAVKLLLRQGDAAADEDKEIAFGLGTQVFKKWAEQDPAGARDLLEDRLARRLAAGGKIGEVEGEFSKELMRAWVKTEPEAAMEWLLKMPDELEKVSIGAAFQSLSHTDPEKALRMVEAQADLPGRADIAGTIAEWWAKTTPDKALEWAKSLPDSLADASVKSAMKSWAAKDMEGAKSALAGLSGELRQAALPSVMQQWPKNQWAGEAAFLDGQPSGSGRLESVGNLVREWAGADQQAASSWLAGQPAGTERDAGALALAEQVRGTDPEAAAAWGATLGNETERRDSLKATMEQWYGKSVSEALEWLRNAKEITDSDRAFLLGEMPGKGE